MFTEQQEILAALCLLSDGEKGVELFSFSSSKDQAGLQAIAKNIIKEEKLDRKDILARIQGLSRTRKFSPLNELHPAWIVERFQDESPQVLGLLCRLLPGEKARYFINHLPADVKKKLPLMSQSYRIPERVSEAIRVLVEKQWSFEMPQSPRSEFSFSHIVWMKPEDVRVLFWDLGLEEIRRAFYHAEPRIFRAFLSRFAAKEAAEIRNRIEQEGPVSSQEKHEAQKHLVSLNMDHLSAVELIREIGYSVFIRAISPQDKEWFSLLIQKMTPEEGHRLRRIFQEVRPHPDVRTMEYQSDVVRRIHKLTKEGLIRRYWKGNP